MILLVDENVSRHVAERLAVVGHTVLRGQDVAPGEPDEEVLVRALVLGTVVITEDTDFGDLMNAARAYVSRRHPPPVVWHGA